MSEIEKIEQSYLDPAFLSGRNHAYTVSRTGRIPGVGEIAVDLDIVMGKITGCHISGDYFSLREGISDVLSEALAGAADDRTEVGERLGRAELSGYIAGLDAAGLMSVLYGGAS